MKQLIPILFSLSLASCAYTDGKGQAMLLLTKGGFSHGDTKLVTDPTGIIQEVGKTVRTYFMWDGIKYMVGSLTDFAIIREQAALTGRLKEFDILAQQQGFTHELNMLKAAPPELAPAVIP